SDEGSSGDSDGDPAPAITAVRARRSVRGVILVWEAVPEALRYEVARRDGATSSWMLIAKNLPRPAYTIESHSAEQEYRLRCVTASGPGPWSSRIRLSGI
ncbi:MAG: hypothetical protein JXM71_08315, partial [Spirochaetales bacterium]|nr:hypothetical protein [Spirochaetales bacterium]